MIEFSQAQTEDLEAVHVLFVACGKDLLRRGRRHWENPPPRDRLLTEIERKQVWVGRLDDAVIATWTILDGPSEHAAEADFWTDQPDVMYVAGLGVHPAHQHQGIGLKCARCIERIARHRGVTRIRFDASADDEDLVRFYRELGCVEAGRVEDGQTICFEYPVSVDPGRGGTLIDG